MVSPSNAVILFVILVIVKVSDSEQYKTFSKPDITEYVTSFGYPIEAHEVITEDGYILKLFRMQYGRKIKNSKKKRPVILMHAVLAGAESYVMLGPNRSLAFRAAKAGYDVWLPNCRGTTHSRKHVSMDPDKNNTFWDFSWHEIGKYDLPIIIDKVIEKSGHQQVMYTGHSQGGALIFVIASERPEYKEKISKVVLMAPAVYFNNYNYYYLRDFVAGFQSYYEGFKQVNSGENLFYVNFNDLRYFIYAYKDIIPGIFRLVWDLFNGESEVTDYKSVFEFFATLPAGCSVKQFAHFAQNYKNKSFKLFDYGAEQNLKVYNNKIPPDYNITAMDMPTYLFGSKTDVYVNIKDLEYLRDKITNLKMYHIVPVNKFAHLDFVVAKNLDELVVNHIINIFGNCTNKEYLC